MNLDKISDRNLSKKYKLAIIPDTMQALTPLVETAQFKFASDALYEMLEMGDNISVLFFPYMDRIKRLEQFVYETSQRKRSTYTRVYIFSDPNMLDVQEEDDLLEYITKELLKEGVIKEKASFEQILKHLSRKNIQIVLVFLAAENILLPKNSLYLAALHNILHTYSPYIVSISCFEIDITHPHYAQTLRQYPQLVHNIFYYPLYERKDTVLFIHYLSKKWNIDISKEQTERIFTVFGGNWWFIKDAMRQLRIHKEWRDDTEGMIYRKNMLVASLLKTERSSLLKVLTGRKVFDENEKHSLHHLTKLNVISDQNILKLQVLRKALLSSFDTTRSLTCESNMVYLNQVPVGKFFSRKELRALKIFVSKPGILIPREELGRAIWPIDTKENYSNWAIDQIIARIRKRLPELEISPSSIKSIRGKGYTYIQI